MVLRLSQPLPGNEQPEQNHSFPSSAWSQELSFPQFPSVRLNFLWSLLLLWNLSQSLVSVEGVLSSRPSIPVVPFLSLLPSLVYSSRFVPSWMEEFALRRTQ